MWKTCVLFACAAVLLTACPRNATDHSQAGPDKAPQRPVKTPQTAAGSTTAMAPAIPPGQETKGSRSMSRREQAVNVRLSEYEIAMPDTLPSGKVALVLANAGNENHGFEIHGGTLDAILPRQLAPGRTATFHLVLQPGTYHVGCPVEGHAMKGMSRTFVVK